MPAKATTVEEYLAALPADRRADIEAVRTLVREHIDGATEEGMQYGMISWYKACLRFKSLDDIAPDVIGTVIERMPIARYLEEYVATVGEAAWKRKGARKGSA